MKLGVYVHIPFCKQKCLYCDFVSYAQKEQMEQRYVQVLKKEINNWFNQKKNAEIETIYIGGGTPSYIESKYIREILEVLKQWAGKDFISTTIEVNPGTVTKQKLIDYYEAGVNRLSIGLQSTDNRLLKKIGRIHTYEDFLDTYKMARKVGFENINVDLMIGLPSQKVEDVKISLQKLADLSPCEPEHISVYSLIVEENTPIAKLLNEGVFKLPDDEQERRAYWYVKYFLEKRGYKHYEISNFAKPGFESKHNLDCWSQKEYIGFGVAAHSYIGNKRFCDISNLEKYVQNIEEEHFDDNIIVEEVQDKVCQMKEYMIIGLRKIDGISIKCFEKKFNENPLTFFEDELNKLIMQELIIIDGDAIKITNLGLDFANIVWEEFV